MRRFSSVESYRLEVLAITRQGKVLKIDVAKLAFTGHKSVATTVRAAKLRIVKRQDDRHQASLFELANDLDPVLTFVHRSHRIVDVFRHKGGPEMSVAIQFDEIVKPWANTV